ncbi:MAG: serine/threonine-protein kinase [Labilithrix sp.]
MPDGREEEAARGGGIFRRGMNRPRRPIDGTIHATGTEAMVSDTTGGMYELGFPIGTGGMAVVRFGRRRGPSGCTQAVAIKELHPHLASNPDLVAMFLDEARLAGRIMHPNVVPTLDLVDDGTRVWAVMPYIEGESLAALTASGSAPPTAVAIAIGLDLLAGLDAAHRATDEKGEPLGIVHRDVSPQNVIVGTDGVARVLDFGIAKARGRIHETRDGQVKGKLAYMAPEQLGGDASIASDVYAAGIVLWELLANQRLFDAETDLELIGHVLAGATSAPSAHAAHVTPALDAIVMRALSSVPSERYPSAATMAEALSIAAEGRVATRTEVAAWVESLAKEALATRRSLAAAAPAAIVHAERSSAGRAALVRTVVMPPPVMKPPRRRRSVLLGAALVTAAAAGALAAFGGSVAFAKTAPAASAAVLAPPPAMEAMDAVTTTPAAPPLATVTPMAEPRPKKTSSKRAAPAATTTERAHATDECDPPFVVDASGLRRYKRACIR